MTIPKITDERLNELYAQIKPVIRENGKIREVKLKTDDLRNISYIWEPEFTGEPIEGLKPIGEFRCLHTYGYYGLFKPSAAEVLCQIPENMLSEAKFFEIVKGPKDGNDLNKEREALNKGFHVSKVRVYSK